VDSVFRFRNDGLPQALADLRHHLPLRARICVPGALDKLIGIAASFP
jgi:hypothetical protein